MNEPIPLKIIVIIRKLSAASFFAAPLQFLLRRSVNKQTSKDASILLLSGGIVGWGGDCVCRDSAKTTDTHCAAAHWSVVISLFTSMTSVDVMPQVPLAIERDKPTSFHINLIAPSKLRP